MTDLPQPQRLIPGLLTAEEAGLPPLGPTDGDLSRIRVYAPRTEEERQAIKAMIAERNAQRAKTGTEAQVLG